MKVILKKRVANLGHEWDIVNVKDGYARNFLLPQKLASMATPKLIAQAAKNAEERVKKMEEMVSDAKEIAKKLEGAALTFKKKARGEKLYGSITEKDIVDAIKKEYKLELDKESVSMKEHLKTLGDHKVKLKFTEGVTVQIAIKIVAE